MSSVLSPVFREDATVRAGSRDDADLEAPQRFPWRQIVVARNPHDRKSSRIGVFVVVAFLVGISIGNEPRHLDEAFQLTYLYDPHDFDFLEVEGRHSFLTRNIFPLHETLLGKCLFYFYSSTALISSQVRRC